MISKETSRAEHEYMNNTPLPPINVLATAVAIACLNVNSLLAHIDQLRFFHSIHKIDILTVNEAKLDSSISSNEIHISSCDVVRRDRCHNGRHGGGVCIFIKNNRNSRIREDLSKFLAIEVCKPHSRPFLVAT